MSELTTLQELAKLAAIAHRTARPARTAAGGSVFAVDRHSSARPRVADLLGVVMALSARTRRVTRDPVEIDLDVFAPDGSRAVDIVYGELSD
jgi:hypothetical protein